MARKSHKDKVAEFNKKLDNMTEHFDIPKVRTVVVDGESEFIYALTCNSRLDQDKTHLLRV
jgi:hypothetical protein